MELEPSDPALQAANVALSGRRLERAASRFASVQLRDIDMPTRSDQDHVVWEVAAVCSIAVAALLLVFGLWLL